MCVSSHRCATEDTQLTVFSCCGKIFWKKEQKFKVHGTISKDYLGNGNQYGLKKER